MALRLTPVSPSALANGNNNNYAGVGTKSIARLSADAGGSTLTGMVAGGDGDIVIIICIANTLTISHQDGNSTDVNRFLSTTAASLTLSADDIAMAVYDAVTQRWRVWEVP